MSIKLLNLNIYKGTFLKEIIEFIKTNNFDILTLQEVTGGSESFENKNCFQEIASLGYDGELVVTWRKKGARDTYFSNATFFKHPLTLLNREEIWMKEFLEIEHPEKRAFEDDPRAALSLTLEYHGKKIQIINTHLAWSPTPRDSFQKLIQGKFFFDYMKHVTKPYIMCGDFNVDQHSQVVTWFDTIGKNLIHKHNIKNTINHKLHKAGPQLPENLVVDFMYVDDRIQVEKFEVPQVDLSDHYPLILEFSL